MARLDTWPLTTELEKLKKERHSKGTLINKIVTNDHENVVQKLKYFTSYGCLIGAVTSGVHVLNAPRKKIRVHAAAYRTVFMAIVPAGVMGATYAASVKVVADIRGRDDPFNHVAAGFIAGSVFGARTKSQRNGMVMGGVLALFGAVLKLSHTYGWRVGDGLGVFPHEPRRFMHFYHYKRSYMPGEPVLPLEKSESSPIP